MKRFFNRGSLALLLLVILAGAAVILFLRESGQRGNGQTESAYVFADVSPDRAIEEGDAVSAVEKEGQEHSYAVSSSSDIATSVGMSVLEAGGNAVDAAVAVAYTLSVVEPYASGLGGSGGLLVYDMNTEECIFYDYRACAGSSARPADLVGVPGFVAGMEALHEDYGLTPMEELLAPAIYYAENGFEINDTLAYRINAAWSSLEKFPMLYNEDGGMLTAGDTMQQPELADTLREIQRDGAEIFYKGHIAEDIAAQCSLTAEDFASYQVWKRGAVEGEFEGNTVYGAGAPLSGITLIQMLEMAEELELADPSEDSVTYLSQIKQLTAAAYSDRYFSVADPAFFDIDEQDLVSREYILGLLGRGIVTAEGDDEESTETTSFCVVDTNGLVVSATNTLSSFWGSKNMVDGIFLNNTNSNFSNNGINVYQPGMRSRTFTAPTIIVGEGDLVMAMGTPGGNNIPSRLCSVITDILKFGIEPQEAVNRAGVIYRNGVLTMESGRSGDMWIDISDVEEDIVWRNTGYWWGSVSLAGYSDSRGAFAVVDDRRGATKAGVYNYGG